MAATARVIWLCACVRYWSFPGVGTVCFSSCCGLVNVYYPFIDHVIVELETRFSEDHKGLKAAQKLVPVHLNGKSD